MSISIANAVPGPAGQGTHHLRQSENAGKTAMGRASCAVTQRSSDVTFGVKDVSIMFHTIHFETYHETCNKQENSGDEGQGRQDAQ